MPDKTYCYPNSDVLINKLNIQNETDLFFLLEANKRLENSENKETVSYDSVMKHLGISEAELLEAEDADIE